jgi:hypothetical protein
MIFQGMDAAGKDGAVCHVMSGVNPPRKEDFHEFRSKYAYVHCVKARSEGLTENAYDC